MQQQRQEDHHEAPLLPSASTIQAMPPQAMNEDTSGVAKDQSFQAGDRPRATSSHRPESDPTARDERNSHVMFPSGKRSSTKRMPATIKPNQQALIELLDPFEEASIDRSRDKQIRMQQAQAVTLAVDADSPLQPEGNDEQQQQAQTGQVAEKMGQMALPGMVPAPGLLVLEAMQKRHEIIGQSVPPANETIEPSV